MAETKKKLPMFGQELDVSEIPIVKATENFNELELEDGSILKVKSVAISVMRVDNQYLPDGKPIYIVITNPVIKVESSPLMKKLSS